MRHGTGATPNPPTEQAGTQGNRRLPDRGWINERVDPARPAPA